MSPLGEKATDDTLWSWPCIVLTHSNVWLNSHSFIDMSALQDAGITKRRVRLTFNHLCRDFKVYLHSFVRCSYLCYKGYIRSKKKTVNVMDCKLFVEMQVWEFGLVMSEFLCRLSKCYEMS